MKSVITFTLIGVLLSWLGSIDSACAQNCETLFLAAFKEESANIRLNEAIIAYNSFISDLKTDHLVREKAITKLEACYLRRCYQTKIELRGFLGDTLEKLTQSLTRTLFSVASNYKSVKSY